jgi:hypothetical protein
VHIVLVLYRKNPKVSTANISAYTTGSGFFGREGQSVYWAVDLDADVDDLIYEEEDGRPSER